MQILLSTLLICVYIERKKIRLLEIDKSKSVLIVRSIIEIRYDFCLVCILYGD